MLRQQQVDLSGAIDALLDDIAAGRKYMKVYKQMKMYNDPSSTLSCTRPNNAGPDMAIVGRAAPLSLLVIRLSAMGDGL